MSDEPSTRPELNLDEILWITETDADTAVEAAAQTHAVQHMVDRLGAALAALEIAQNNLTEQTADPQSRQRVRRLFEGMGATVALDRVADTAQQGLSGLNRIVEQPEVLTKLSTDAIGAHLDVADLRTERDRLLYVSATNPSDPELVGKFGADDGSGARARQINEYYDGLARQRFESASTGYIAEVGKLAPVQPVKGAGPAQHQMKPDRDVQLLREQTWSGSKSVAMGPELQGGSWNTHTAVGDKAPVANGSGAHVGDARTSYSGMPGVDARAGRAGAATVGFRPPTPTTGLVPYLPQRPVVAPVIGARGTGHPPVVPSRPGFGSNGVLPSTIGGRAGGSGPVRPGPLATGPGTRHPVRPAVSPAGRIITSRPKPAGGTKTVPAPGFDRAPRIRHGGADGLNRPVIVNSRLPRHDMPQQPVPASGGRPADSGDVWSPAAATSPAVIRGQNRESVEPPPPYHGDDTGPVVTAYTFGRSR